jgi:hypothetical protein
MSFARVSDIVQFSRRDLKGFEKDVLRFGKDGRRALRNAHKAAVDIVNQEARDKYQKMTIRPERPRTGKGGATTYKRKGKDRKIVGFRAGIRKKGSWSTQTEFKAEGVVTRSWINDKERFNFVAAMIEWGFTPGKGTKKEGKKVPKTEIRYSAAQRLNRRVIDAMAVALTTQMAKGKTMTPKELANVIR